MDVALWGRDSWNALEELCRDETGALGLPQATLIKATLRLCPCSLCQFSAEQFLLLIPLKEIARGQEVALQWVWRLHNWVNQKLNKPQLPMVKLRKRMALAPATPTAAMLTTVRFLGWIGGHEGCFARPEMALLLQSVAAIVASRPHHGVAVAALSGPLARAVAAQKQEAYFVGLAELRNLYSPHEPLLSGDQLLKQIVYYGQHDPAL